MNPTSKTNDAIVVAFKTFKEAYMYHLENEDTLVGEPDIKRKVNAVAKCVYCGSMFWGNHSSRHCPSVECTKKAQKISRDAFRARKRELKESSYRPVAMGYRVEWEEMKEKTTNLEIVERAIADSDEIRERKETINEWNARHCCPFFEGSEHGSLKCFYCMRGINYAGAETVSNRRCPKNPIATDGSRYIQRAAYRKDSHSAIGIKPGKRYDVLDNMPQHLKVELVERMRKLGREFYIWNNGHVDVTPDPDSNN